MPQYHPPIRDMQFLLHEVLDAVGTLQQLPPYADIDADTINAVLEEGGKFASQVTAPLNLSGDFEGCSLDPASHVALRPRASSRPMTPMSPAAGRR